MSKVAVIILTKNNFDVFKKCVDSIVKYNTYNDIELFIGDTGSNESQFDKLKQYIKNIPYDKQLIRYNHYNFAENNNWIVNNMFNDHEYILFCNDDIEFRCDVITEMLNHTSSNVATIGCKLLFPNDTIQHAGHLHIKPSIDSHQAVDYNITHRLLGQPDQQIETQQVDGNTFALCLVSCKIYKQLNMLNETYEHCFEDADFCIKASKKSFKHVCVGDVSCLHHESLTRKKQSTYISHTDFKMLQQQLYNLYNDS